MPTQISGPSRGPAEARFFSLEPLYLAMGVEVEALLELLLHVFSVQIQQRALDPEIQFEYHIILFNAIII